MLAVSKSDKLKPQKRAAAVAALRRDSDLRNDPIIVTSAEKGTGIEARWTLLAPE